MGSARRSREAMTSRMGLLPQELGRVFGANRAQHHGTDAADGRAKKPSTTEQNACVPAPGEGAPRSMLERPFSPRGRHEHDGQKVVYRASSVAKGGDTVSS